VKRVTLVFQSLKSSLKRTDLPWQARYKALRYSLHTFDRVLRRGAEHYSRCILSSFCKFRFLCNFHLSSEENIIEISREADD